MNCSGNYFYYRWFCSRTLREVVCMALSYRSTLISVQLNSFWTYTELVLNLWWTCIVWLENAMGVLCDRRIPFDILTKCFCGLVHVYYEFSASLERVEFYRNYSSVTCTPFRVFRGYIKSIERREERAIHITDVSKCDYRISHNENYYPSNSLYSET